jgi:hypothetical protein
MMLPRLHSQEIPAGFNVERYAAVWERNPFVLEKEAAPQAQHSAFDKLYLVSWLIDGGKAVILVENAETKEVQRICKDPNSNNVCLITMHLSPNPRSVEALISDGKEQGTLKFRYDDQLSSGLTNSTLAQAADANGRERSLPVADSQTSISRPSNLPSPLTPDLNRPPGSRLYPGLPRVHWEGGKPGGSTAAPSRQKRHFAGANNPTAE